MSKCIQLHMRADRLKKEVKEIEKDIETVRLILAGNSNNQEAKQKLAFLHRQHGDVSQRYQEAADEAANCVEDD